MAIKIKVGRAGKLILGGLIVGGLVLAYSQYQKAPKTVKEVAKVDRVSLPDAPEASFTTASQKVPLPSTEPSSKGSVFIKWNQMAWNSQTGANFANGGPLTTKGSLVEQAGLNIKIVVQNDCSKSIQDMVKYIQDYKSGATKDGFFITFMGSGIPAYISSISRAVKELGPEYQPVAFWSFGKSYGEDQIMGDASIKSNPKENLKGKVVRGVRMDGDHDIAIKYAKDNGVEVNPNDKLYYPDRLNLSYSATFLSAVDDYNNELTEKRKIVINGKTGKDTLVKMDMVATWFPGDDRVANGTRGGVTLASTRTYASMMPNITITCKKFLNDNRSAIVNLMVAVGKAGDQVRSFDDVKRHAAGINAKIWEEQDGAYWYKGYNGYKKDNNTLIGGSMVYNLADMGRLFGIGGGLDVYKEVYNTFGNIQSLYYPEDFPALVPYTQAVDKSLMAEAITNHSSEGGAALESKYNDQITEQVSSKDVKINFETGSAVISPSSRELLDEIFSSTVTAEGLKLGIYGHTDNAGSPESNQFLSEKRAHSVRQYLIRKGIPDNRIEAKGYGETDAIADNATETGRAKNRRVQIVLGN